MISSPRILPIALLCTIAFPALAQQPRSQVLPAGARVYIAPMKDGFDDFLKAALVDKKVPVTVVADKSQAQYELTGHSETEKAGAAKKVFMMDWRSNEQASIQVADLSSGEVVFAYSVNKKSSAHGKKSTAEACAKHLKKKVDSKR